MKKTAVLSFFLLVFIYPSLARGQTPELPKIDGWTVESKSKIEVQVTDFATLYLGLEIEYRNPADQNEFVWVVKRYAPFIVSRIQPKDERSFSEAVVGFYTKKDLEDTLKKIDDESDAIIYQRWRVEKDPNTGQSVQPGKTETWLLDSMGLWRFETGQKVSTGSVSELKTADFKDGVPAGVEYSVGDFHQILKIEHGYLVLALKEEK